MGVLVNNNEVEFFELSHQYFIGGKELIGVTSLMKKHGLGANYDGIPEDVLKKAAERGTEIHKLLEAYDNGEVVAETPELKAYKKLGLDVMRSEYLISDNEMVASMIDKVLWADEPGMVDLGDVKTTSTLHKEALSWQLSIYAYLFERQNPGIKVRNLIGIHVRDGKAKTARAERKSDALIEELFQAEREGRIFSQDSDTPHALAVLSFDEVMALEQAETILAQIAEQKKNTEELIADIKDKLYCYMQDNNIDEITCGDGVYKRKRESIRESIDTARLKKDLPEIAEKYTKTTSVKGSITFKTK